MYNQVNEATDGTMRVKGMLFFLGERDADDGGDGWKVVDVTWHGDFLNDTCDLSPVILNDAYVTEQGPFSWP